MTSEVAENKFQTIDVFGRVYHVFSIDNNVNWDPVDEEEEERLQGQHEILKRIFCHRTNPLLPDSVINPGKVLDCGFGAGDWAIEVAELYPDCEVYGLDISPILVDQNERPENFFPQIADLNISEQSFTFPPDTFDLVCTRFVAGGIAQTRWPSYVTDIRRVLRRGGVVEFVEWDLNFRSDKGNGDRLSALRQWSSTYFNAIAAGQNNGRKSTSSPPDLASIMRVSGFDDVVSMSFDVPVSDWQTESVGREVGQENGKNIQALLTACAIFPVVNRNIMTEASFRELVQRCIEEISNPSSEIYLRLFVFQGRKA